jgi:hypothetical protein
LQRALVLAPHNEKVLFEMEVLDYMEKLDKEIDIEQIPSIM